MIAMNYCNIIKIRKFTGQMVASRAMCAQVIYELQMAHFDVPD